jgi:hypothetical protein
MSIARLFAIRPLLPARFRGLERDYRSMTTFPWMAGFHLPTPGWFCPPADNWDLVRDGPATLRDKMGTSDFQPIACVVGAASPTGNMEVSDYYRRWRIADYVVVAAVDREANLLCPDVKK